MQTEPGTVRSLDALLNDCVHCGFCLPACPTYRAWGDEMDSPRGRIDLVRGAAEGVMPIDIVVREHIDQCLGCMGCMTACPSGVRYDLIVETARAQVEEAAPRAPGDRAFRELVFALFPYRRRLRALMVPLYLYAASGLRALVRASGLVRLLPQRLQQLDALTPPVRRKDLRARLPRRTRARGERRARAVLVEGCVQGAFFPDVNAATVRVLAAEGCDVAVPRGQGCCGALSLHSGRPEEAKRFARALIGKLGDGDETIVVNAAGCGSTLKQYGELFAEEPEYRERAERFAERVRDVNEFLAELGPVAPRRPVPLRVAYHDACHLAHAQRVRSQPRELLRSIPGVELCEIPDGDQCCGSAGTYNLFEPEASREIGRKKVDAIASVAPELLATANPGCTLQIRSLLRERGATLNAAHPIQLLDAAINGTPLPE